jgi:hypothetical protein
MSLPTTGRVMAEAPMADAEDTMPGAAKKRPACGRDLVDVHIGYRIRKRRLMLGMSQSALGQSLDVSFQTVQPCKRFKQDGFYLLHAPNGFEVRNCRAVENGREIEIISPGGRTRVSKELFCEIVEGRVIGIALLGVGCRESEGLAMSESVQ